MENDLPLIPITQEEVTRGQWLVAVSRGVALVLFVVASRRGENEMDLVSIDTKDERRPLGFVLHRGVVNDAQLFRFRESKLHLPIDINSTPVSNYDEIRSGSIHFVDGQLCIQGYDSSNRLYDAMTYYNLENGEICEVKGAGNLYFPNWSIMTKRYDDEWTPFVNVETQLLAQR